MLEKIDQLERRVETLITLLEELQRENEQLHTKLEQVRMTMESQTELVERNQDLADQVGHLATEVEGMNGKESQMRDRLQGILARIDSLQLELTGQAQSGH
jgi:seryl-tRNA synthetase